MEAYLQGRWHDARKRIERILTLDETDADALMHLGTLHLRLEQPARARQAFRQCLELEGGQKWRAEIHEAMKRLDSDR
jgi:Flp pilus assembly protein TadD